MPRILCFGLWLGLLGSTTFAQLSGLDELYGEGVHRYFANDLTGAEQILSQAINSGSQDPRVYYFRGLVQECMGGGGEADFESGARLEAEGKRVVDVGNALSRIQGAVRTKIEQARLDARIRVKQQQLMLEQARQRHNEANASRMGTAPPSNASPFPTESIPANDTGLAPVTPAAPAAPASDTSDPFTDEPAPANDTAPANDSAPASADPFGAPTTEAPAATDPFGAPATETPAPSTPAVDDPFGTPAGDTPAAADPFGGTP